MKSAEAAYFKFVASDYEVTEAWEEYQMTVGFYMLELTDTSTNPL